MAYLKKRLKLLIYLGLIPGTMGCQKPTPPQPPTQATQVQNESALSVFQLPNTWTNQNGENITLASWNGKPALVAMVYTTCTFSCPKLLADMRRIEKQIPEADRKRMRFALISIDPERDTPEKLKQFAADNHLDLAYWELLRGTRADVDEMAAVLGFKYQKTSPVDFAHANLLSLFSPSGVLVHQTEGIGNDGVEMANQLRQHLKS